MNDVDIKERRTEIYFVVILIHKKYILLSTNVNKI